MEKLKTGLYLPAGAARKAEWLGKCPNCQPGTVFWSRGYRDQSQYASDKNTTPPEKIIAVAFEAFERFPRCPSANQPCIGRRDCTGVFDFNWRRPGIGKSTLLLQASALLAKAQGKWSMFPGRNPEPDKNQGKMLWAINAAHYRNRFPLWNVVDKCVGLYSHRARHAGSTNHDLIPSMFRAIITIGFIGSFTTFSTFSYETMKLLEDGALVSAMMNIASNVGLGLIGTFAGYWLGKIALEVSDEGTYWRTGTAAYHARRIGQTRRQTELIRPSSNCCAVRNQRATVLRGITGYGAHSHPTPPISSA